MVSGKKLDRARGQHGCTGERVDLTQVPWHVSGVSEGGGGFCVEATAFL